MQVDGNISDLFFNTEHHAEYDDRGQFVEHDQLETEADDFWAASITWGYPFLLPLN